MAKQHTYKGSDIEVSFDPSRCIHAAECVRGNREVFDPKRRPWVEPDRGTANAIAEIIQRCPTGALTFTRLDGGAAEGYQPSNTLKIVPSGPVHVVGDISITHVDDSVSHERRVALCRCGASKNKPFCDNQHLAIGFQDSGSVGSAKEIDATEDQTSLEVRVVRNGPLLLEGPHHIEDAEDRLCLETGRGSLCRCGASDNKPYCDGSHRAVAFRDP